MWRDLEEEAIYIGLTLNYFWSLNPKEYAKHCKIYIKKEKQYLEIKDKLNHILGQYIAIAFNDVEHYPSTPYLHNSKPVKDKPQTVADMERIARNNTLMLGGVINN